MTSQHEIIAAEGGLLETTKQMLAEASTTFKKRTEHFRAEDKTLRMFDDNRKEEDSAVTGKIVTTVNEKLDHCWKAFTKSINATATKELTNTLAQADLVIDGEVLIANVPAIALLSLESTLNKIRALYNDIPTLEPTTAWTLDEATGRDIYKSEVMTTFRTEKSIVSTSLAPATEHHPEQVHVANKDVNIGKYEAVKRSGMLTPRQKSERLDRLTTLISGVKQARQRANMQTVTKSNLGNVVADFLAR